jgi:ribosome-associated heat shock protein Hsp15
MTEMYLDKSLRLDKWLKVSRLFKTRTLAARACNDGKVKVNEQKAKASHLIRIGDEVTIRQRGKYRTFDVADISEKNVSKADAKSLYNEHTPNISDDAKELVDMLKQWDRKGKRKYKGRPTKKERRDLDKFKGGL